VPVNIQFSRLSQISLNDIIELNTNGRVLKQIPLADGINFDEKQCIAWANAKEKQWQEYGYGPWAFVVDGKFAGWGGLQYEAGDADLALVLHPDYWGLGKRIFAKITQQAFNQMGLQSITILLPPTRVKLQGIYQLGFALDGEVVINNQPFIRYRLCKPSCIEYGG